MRVLSPGYWDQTPVLCKSSMRWASSLAWEVRFCNGVWTYRETQRSKGTRCIHLWLSAWQVSTPFLQDPSESLSCLHQTLCLWSFPQEAHSQKRLLSKLPLIFFRDRVSPLSSADLEFLVLLPLPPMCWNYIHNTWGLTIFFFFFFFSMVCVCVCSHTLVHVYEPLPFQGHCREFFPPFLLHFLLERSQF